MTKINIGKKIFSSIGIDIFICLFFAIVTLAVYWQVGNFSFINYDDPLYVTKNSQVQAGLTLKSFIWSFTTTHAANWHPSTWLSHMLDVQLFGLNSGKHHLTNVFFHIANTVLLFLILRKMTSEIWKSAFVAALFALHPLHVQSVAWVSERKDVLSTFFWLLTMGAYLWYAKRPFYTEGSSAGRYVLVIFLFLMGLLAKPMLVTLPCVLLLIDYWPLNRFQERPSRGSNNKQTKSIVLALIYEKVPFFILSATFCVVALTAQIKGGTFSALDVLPLKIRFLNAIIAYVVYLGKMIWPFNLSFIYPHTGIVKGWQAVGASLFLAIIFLMGMKTARQFPYFIVGWLWYIGTLVPVIGLIQVGEQSLADRYTYVPLIGIFI
ncbi:MAG: hypothetical protein PVG17_19680, partial [Desulfobacterales bacterium]